MMRLWWWLSGGPLRRLFPFGFITATVDYTPIVRTVDYTPVIRTVTFDE